MSESCEYKTVMSCTKQLELALYKPGRSIAHFLRQEGFISPEMCDDVLNPRSTLTEHQKAGELVAGIRNKVELSSQYYHTLLDHLRKGGKFYEVIVNILDKEYSRQKQTASDQDQGSDQADTLEPTVEHDQGVDTHDHSSTSSTTSPLPPPTKHSKCTVSGSCRVRHKYVKTKKGRGRSKGKRKHATSSSSSASSVSSPSRTTTPPTKLSEKTVSGSRKVKHKHKKTRRVKRKHVTSSSSSASSASSDSGSAALEKPRHKKHSKCTDNDAMSRYRKYLKSYYSNYLIVPDDKLSIAPCSQFISLALIQKGAFSRSALYGGMDSFSKSTLHGGVDEIVASKTPLTLDALVTPDFRFILVEGPPGIGKSTMCWELCREWDTLESLQRFKIVLQLKLRETRVQNATEPNEIFYHRNKKLCQSVVDEVFECEGEGVLLVLDGFDELPASLVSNKGSLIMELLIGACLPKATRLVTSRPSALHYKNIFPNNHRHIEILGFTDEHKSEFADNAFKSEPDVAKHFKTFVSSNPIINSLMYIPVNCAIMAQVFKDIRKSEKPLPKTMTQLYTTLVLVLMKRHMVKDKDYKVLNDLDDLPKEVLSDLIEVSKLAYTGLFKDKITFTESDVRQGFQDLGLLCKTKEMYLLEDAKTSYSFLHLSVQEFLAAWYVSHHSDLLEKVAPKDTISVLLMMHKKQSFWFFLAGLLKYITKYNSLNEDTGTLFSLRCCYEAQDPSVFQSVCISSPNMLKLTNSLDMYIFGYALVHAPIVWSLDIDTSLDILVSSITDCSSSNILGSIKTLRVKLSHCSAFEELPILCVQKSVANLEVNNITDVFLSVLINSVPNMPCLECAALKFSEKCLDECLLYKKLKDIPSLKSLYVYFVSGITSKGLQELSHFLLNHNLQQFSVMYGEHDNTQESIRMQDLVKVAMSCSSLKTFSTNVPYMYRDFPANIELFLFELEQFHFRMPVSRLYDCLCSILNLGKLLTLKYLYVNVNFAFNNLPPGIIFKEGMPEYLLTSEAYSDLLALVRTILHSNPMLNIKVEDLSGTMDSGPKLNCAFHAHRRDPDVVQAKLRQSKSLWDLTSTPPFGKIYTLSNKYHKSCPDLLELQALHNMHPHLCNALGAETFDIRETVKRYVQKDQEDPNQRHSELLRLYCDKCKIPKEYLLNSSYLPTPIYWSIEAFTPDHSSHTSPDHSPRASPDHTPHTSPDHSPHTSPDHTPRIAPDVLFPYVLH